MWRFAYSSDSDATEGHGGEHRRRRGSRGRVCAVKFSGLGLYDKGRGVRRGTPPGRLGAWTDGDGRTTGGRDAVSCFSLPLGVWVAKRKISADSQKGATVATSLPSDTNINRRAPFVVPSRVSVPSPKKAQCVPPPRFGIPPFCGVCRRRLVVKERDCFPSHGWCPGGSRVQALCAGVVSGAPWRPGGAGTGPNGPGRPSCPPGRSKDCHWRW